MFEHDVEDLRRRLAPTNLQPDRVTAPRHPENPHDPQQVGKPSWPTNMFGQNATITELMAALDHSL
jgi:hypothetical protein